MDTAKGATTQPRCVQGEEPTGGHWKLGLYPPDMPTACWEDLSSDRRDSCQRSQSIKVWTARELCTSFIDQWVPFCFSLFTPAQSPSHYISYSCSLLCTGPLNAIPSSLTSLLVSFPLSKATWVFFSANSLWSAHFSTASLAHGMTFISGSIWYSLSLGRKRHF